MDCVGSMWLCPITISTILDENIAVGKVSIRDDQVFDDHVRLVGPGSGTLRSGAPSKVVV